MLEPIIIDIAKLNIPTLIPMLITIVGGLTILIIDLINKDLHKSLYTILSILFVVLDLGYIIGYQGGVQGFFDMMLLDGISLLTQIIILVSSGFFLVLSLSQQRFHEYRYPEYYALFLFMIAGLQFMVSSSNLVMIFIGLETSSMALYVLIAMHNRAKSLEASIKYFTLGAISAAFFAFSVMIFYALSGSMELSQISQVVTSSNFDNYLVVLMGVAFMIGAIGFKLSLVPFHMWAPDVYEGSSSAMAGFISIVPKIAAFVVALRFFEMFIGSNDIWVQNILYGIVVISITLPNLIALVQTDVKRMLAFSSISHAGFVMGAILIGSHEATQGIFLYWIMFASTNIGAFAMLWINRTKSTQGFQTYHQYEKFSGLIKLSPVAASVMGLFMLSLAGVPPFSIFWGKMYILSAAMNSGYIILAFIMIANSAISVYYYIKLIVYMFFKEPHVDKEIEFLGNLNLPLKIVVGLSAILTTSSILFIEPLLKAISYYLQASGF